MPGNAVRHRVMLDRSSTGMWSPQLDRQTGAVYYWADSRVMRLRITAVNHPQLDVDLTGGTRAAVRRDVKRVIFGRNPPPGIWRTGAHGPPRYLPGFSVGLRNQVSPELDLAHVYGPFRIARRIPVRKGPVRIVRGKQRRPLVQCFCTYWFQIFRVTNKVFKVQVVETEFS